MDKTRDNVHTADASRMVSTALLVLWLTAVCSPTVAIAAGEAGAQFLKMGVGARACAMGEAFAAIADDPTAVYWNPAGLGQLDQTEILAMQNFWLLDMSYQYVAAAIPSPYGAFGVTAAYSSSGKIPRYEEFRKVGEYSAYDAAGTLAYATPAASLGRVRMVAGGALKYIQQEIDTVGARGLAGDVGFQLAVSLLRPEEEVSHSNNPPRPEEAISDHNPSWEDSHSNRDPGGWSDSHGEQRTEVGTAVAPRPMPRGIYFGAAVQNVGPGIRFVEQTDPLPMNIKVGVGLRLGPLTLAADVNKPRDNGFRLNVGAEGMILGLLALRAGYNTANSFTAGVGVTWKMVSVDYAFVPYKEIDATHRISARVRF
jgi:hypothetical protein